MVNAQSTAFRFDLILLKKVSVKFVLKQYNSKFWKKKTVYLREIKNGCFDAFLHKKRIFEKPIYKYKMPLNFTNDD